MKIASINLQMVFNICTLTNIQTLICSSKTGLWGGQHCVFRQTDRQGDSIIPPPPTYTSFVCDKNVSKIAHKKT